MSQSRWKARQRGAGPWSDLSMLRWSVPPPGRSPSAHVSQEHWARQKEICNYESGNRRDGGRGDKRSGGTWGGGAFRGKSWRFRKGGGEQTSSPWPAFTYTPSGTDPFYCYWFPPRPETSRLPSGGHWALRWGSNTERSERSGTFHQFSSSRPSQRFCENELSAPKLASAVKPLVTKDTSRLFSLSWKAYLISREITRKRDVLGRRHGTHMIKLKSLPPFFLPKNRNLSRT